MSELWDKTVAKHQCKLWNVWFQEGSWRKNMSHLYNRFVWIVLTYAILHVRENIIRWLPRCSREHTHTHTQLLLKYTFFACLFSISYPRLDQLQLFPVYTYVIRLYVPVHNLCTYCRTSTYLTFILITLLFHLRANSKFNMCLTDENDKEWIDQRIKTHIFRISLNQMEIE